MNNQTNNFQQANFPIKNDSAFLRNQTQFRIFPILSPTQFQAMEHVFKIAGLAEYFEFEAYETRRRCMNLATRIFGKRLPDHKFSAENLIHFANYIDAFHKPGFIWQKTLEFEASSIIPNPPHFEIDPKEFMQSFHILFSHRLNCAGTLTLALFLLFFHRIMIISECDDAIHWDNVVRSVIDRTYHCNYGWGVK